jgi:hypothetical protein
VEIRWNKWKEVGFRQFSRRVMGGERSKTVVVVVGEVF